MKLYVKQIGVILILIFSFNSCSKHKEQKQLTIKDYENAAKHMDRSLNGLINNVISSRKWLSNKHFFYSKKDQDGKKYILVDVNAKEKKEAFDHDKLAESLSKEQGKEIEASDLSIFNVSFSNDFKLLHFRSAANSYTCNLDDYSLSKKEKTNRNGFRNLEIISPNKKLGAFIDNYNLWVRDLETNKKTQLTFDGVEDYGYATNNAGWTKSKYPIIKWSPNSDKIATFQQDARGVGEMYLTSINVGHPKLERWKHPLPGDETIFTIERVIIHLDPKPRVVRLKMNKDFQRSTTTDHIAGGGELLDAQWKEDGSEFAFVSCSRDHKIAHLQIANTNTGEVKSIHKEEVDTYYESGVKAENWRVLFDSNEFIWYSEKTNWGHIYLYDLTTKQLKNQITSGNWVLKRIINIDKKNREIYFAAGGKETGNPYHEYFYKVNFDGSNLINLTPSKGTHFVKFTEDYQYLIDTYSTTTVPKVSVIRNNKGEKILNLESEDISALKEKKWKAPIEFSVKARDNETDLYGIMFLPSTYSENKSYPVINYIYPGPQSGSVGHYGFKRIWGDYQAVSELGFIVVAVDAMGTPMRSKSFHDAYYGNMGDNGLLDNITAIKQLAERYKGMDTTRVGIWGHSGGGYASTRAVFAYPDFYDVAVSGAGNHDNRNYEADWGEKWQGLLTKSGSDGSTNYDNQANQLIAGNLKGKLLITHGSMDDNVPPHNTMLVVEALIKANKDFDMIIFPNQKHGYGNMSKYMTRKRWDYFVTHLLGAKPPQGFSFK